MSTPINPVERERRLSEAARLYLAGEITSAEYRIAVKHYGPDYLAAAKVLGARRARLQDQPVPAILREAQKPLQRVWAWFRWGRGNAETNNR